MENNIDDVTIKDDEIIFNEDENNTNLEDEISLESGTNDIYTESILVEEEGDTNNSWEKNNDEKNSKNARLFLRPLNNDIISNDIREMFEIRGYKVNDAYVPLKKGKSRGYGFVGFETIEEAQKALELKEIEYKGNKIIIANATGKEHFRDEDEPTNIIFLRNLPNKITVEEIERHFVNAKEVRLINNKNGACYGIAFVEYSTKEEAKKMKDNLKDLILNGNKIGLEFAQPKKTKNVNRNDYRRDRRGNYYRNKNDYYNRDDYMYSDYDRNYNERGYNRRDIERNNVRNNVRNHMERRNYQMNQVHTRRIGHVDDFYSIPPPRSVNLPYFSDRRDYNNPYMTNYPNGNYDYHPNSMNDNQNVRNYNSNYINHSNMHSGHFNSRFIRNPRINRNENFYYRPR